MAPRKTTEAAVAAADLPAGQYDAIMAKLSILDTVTEKLEALEALPAKIASLEKLLHEANAKTAALQAEILTKDRTIFDLRVKVNSLEQYNRKWSVRINNLTLPYGDETDTTLVMETVYNKALLPILEGALRSKHITKIPEVHELLETAHILPAKNDNRPKPIIARFYSRNLRALIFRLKREYAPTTTAPPPRPPPPPPPTLARRRSGTPSTRILLKTPSTSCRPCSRTRGRAPCGPSAGTSATNLPATPPSRRCPPSTSQWTRSLLSEFSFSASFELLTMKTFRLWQPPSNLRF